MAVSGSSSDTASSERNDPTTETLRDIEHDDREPLVEKEKPLPTASTAEQIIASATGDRSGKGSPRAVGECRICQEEDVLGNLDAPCSCAGSLKYAHQSCLQHWCNEKKNTMCEICHQPYKATYVAPEAPPQEGSSSVLSIEIREESAPDGTHSRVLTLRDAVTGEETRFDLSEPEEPQDPWACCKMLMLLVFILMFLPRALMLLVDVEDESGDINDSVAFVLRMVGIFLPLFILVRVVTLLHERRREQEAAEVEATEAAAQVAFLLHARHAHFFSRSHGEPSRPATALPLGGRSAPLSAPPIVQGVV